jgi:hypothetical protein
VTCHFIISSAYLATQHAVASVVDVTLPHSYYVATVDNQIDEAIDYRELIPHVDEEHDSERVSIMRHNSASAVQTLWSFVRSVF